MTVSHLSFFILQLCISTTTDLLTAPSTETLPHVNRAHFGHSQYIILPWAISQKKKGLSLKGFSSARSQNQTQHELMLFGWNHLVLIHLNGALAPCIYLWICGSSQRSSITFCFAVLWFGTLCLMFLSEHYSTDYCKQKVCHHTFKISFRQYTSRVQWFTGAFWVYWLISLLPWFVIMYFNPGSEEI